MLSCIVEISWSLYHIKLFNVAVLIGYFINRHWWARVEAWQVHRLNTEFCRKYNDGCVIKNASICIFSVFYILNRTIYIVRSSYYLPFRHWSRTTVESSGRVTIQNWYFYSRSDHLYFNSFLKCFWSNLQNSFFFFGFEHWKHPESKTTKRSISIIRSYLNSICLSWIISFDKTWEWKGSFVKLKPANSYRFQLFMVCFSKLWFIWLGTFAITKIRHQKLESLPILKICSRLPRVLFFKWCLQPVTNSRVLWKISSFE